MAGEVMAFYSNYDSLDTWRAALAPLLPGVPLQPEDEIDDPAAVRYALVWKPPAGFFQRFPGLRLVVTLGAGVDSLAGRGDLPDVPITRLSDPDMARMMASYVLYAVLRYARDMPYFERAQRQARWGYRHPRHPSELRVGVMGLGELGLRAARELVRQGFDVRGWSRSPKQEPGMRCLAGPDTLREFLSGCDILAVMLPLTAATRGLLDAEKLGWLPEGACFINVARGPIVDQAALTALLASGRIAEAMLDVFEQEPLPADSPLWHMDNVRITPHIASVAIPASAGGQIAENVRRVRRGETVLNQVDLARGY